MKRDTRPQEGFIPDRYIPQGIAVVGILAGLYAVALALAWAWNEGIF